MRWAIARRQIRKAKVNREINHDKIKYEVKFEITQYTQVELGEVKIPLVNKSSFSNCFSLSPAFPLYPRASNPLPFFPVFPPHPRAFVSCSHNLSVVLQ